jgi:hypothetical protein
MMELTTDIKRQKGITEIHQPPKKKTSQPNTSGNENHSFFGKRIEISMETKKRGEKDVAEVKIE